MPFGLTNTPTTFQAMVNHLFRPYLHCFMLFFNDILIYSPSLSEHLQHLDVVFKLLQDHQFLAKLVKCMFVVNTIAYLAISYHQRGYILTQKR